MVDNKPERKVLILCDAFPPAFGPRMGYLCKYLADSNWKPTVVVESVPGKMFSFLADSCPVHFVNFYKKKGKWSSRLEWMKTFLADLLFDYKDRCMIQTAEKVMLQERFDLILCSTYRTFPLPAALQLAQKHNLPLIADNRDIIEQYPGNEFMHRQFPSIMGIDKLISSFFRNKLLKERNSVLRAADCVITISPWHVSTLKQYNPNVELIYNGFDPELFYPVPAPSPLFTITYTGRLISTAMGNPELLFLALKKLGQNGDLPASECRVSWYVDKTSEEMIRQEVKKHQVEEFMDYHEFVPGQEVPGILNQSSVLLVLCNKSSGTGLKGLMSTKFFEFIGVEKPILCIQSDEDCLEAAIHEANAGLAGRTVEEVCEFLTSTYRQWKEQGFTSAPIRREVLSKYSRKEQAAQFVRIFESVIANKR